MKPFDLEAAKRGEPVVTRSGRPIKFGAYIDGAKYPLVMLLSENIFIFDVNGSHAFSEGKSDYDLFMASRKRTVWVNLYPCGGTGDWFYESQSDADAASEPAHNRIGGRAWPVEIED